MRGSEEAVVCAEWPHSHFAQILFDNFRVRGGEEAGEEEEAREKKIGH